MPRPTSTVRAGGSQSADFLGLNDATAVSIGEAQASVLQNLVKKRRSLKRRGGQSALGSASLSPDQAINMLEWEKIGSTEHLLGVHNRNLVDFFAASVGATVPNGANKFTASTDANAAWVEGKVYIGDGTAPNVRYNGATGSSDFAADFDAASLQYMSHATNAILETGDVDFTIAAWVYFDSLAADRPIVAKWDNSTSSQREWRLWYNQAAGKLEFSVWNFSGPTFADALSATAVTTNTWYYVVGWHDSVLNTVNISVNDGAVVTTAYSSGITSNTVDFTVGRLTTGATYMDGRVARIGFWKSAASGGGVLSAALRTSLYNAASGKAYADLTVAEKVALQDYWNLSETSGARADSVVASSNHLGVFNAPGSAQGVAYALAAAQAMTSQCPATFTLVDQSGLLTAGTYSYRVSFVNADGVYGEPSDAVEYTTRFSPNNRNIQINSIPTAASSEDCSARIIWRKKDDEDDYRLVTTIADNTTTGYLDVTDGISDNEILILGNSQFPATQYNCEHQGRLLGAGNATDQTQWFISNKDEPWYCPESPDLDDPNQGTRSKLHGPAAGKTTGVHSYGGVGVIFTGGAGFALLGDAAANYAVHKFCDHGCVSHRTIQSGRNYLLWLGPDGVYLWAGQLQGENVVRISEDVRGTLEAMTAAEMSTAHAYIFDDKYYLCWATGCIWYDLNYKMWGSYTNWLWNDATVSTVTSDARQRVWGAYLSHARVYQLETGATDSIPSASTAIPCRWASRDWDMGLPGREKRVHWVESKTKVGTGTATIKLFTDTEATTPIQTLSHNTATVPTGSAAATVSKALQSAVEQARAEHFRLDFTISPTGTEFELLALGLHYTLST